jgi:hypothetical protein
MKRVKFVGLDVHAETIAIAVAEPGGEVRSLGVIPNREDSVRKRKETGAASFTLYFGIAMYVLNLGSPGIHYTISDRLLGDCSYPAVCGGPQCANRLDTP